MYSKLSLMITALVLFVSDCAGQKQDGFVKVNGNQFEINGKPYYYLGTNLWYGANLGAPNKSGDRERLIKELDLLKSLGINNLRIMGASEGNTQANTVNPPIQPKPGEYNEKVLQGLDFLLAEMSKREMYAVIYLNNFWVWSGGMSQYLSWVLNTPVPNPFLEQYSWGEFMNFSASFYENKEANQIFKDYIKKLINRKNSYSGIYYKDDPVIMSWQLANEPRPGHGEEGKENFKAFSAWINETASYIKSLDENHLISTGNEGMAGSLFSDTLYKEIHSYDSIDYMTFHMWLLNWSWFDPLQAETTYPEAIEKATAYISEHIDYANEVRKPLVIEEFGIPRDNHVYSPEATTIYRDRYFEFVFNIIYENSKIGGPLVGSNFWGWGGYGKAREPKEAVWEAGDDFTGDPPQEPQGRNSVFSADSSTVKILEKYATLMKNLK